MYCRHIIPIRYNNNEYIINNVIDLIFVMLCELLHKLNSFIDINSKKETK